MKFKFFTLTLLLLFTTTLMNANNYFKIKNRWTGEYLHIENKLGHLELSKNVSKWWSAQWERVNVGNGYFRLRNRWTQEYLHIEDQLGHTQLNKIGPRGGWWSSQWDKVSVGNGYFRLRNRWTQESLHIQDRLGHTQLGRSVPMNWWSAQWSFEKVNERVAQPLPITPRKPHYLICKGDIGMNLKYNSKREKLKFNFIHASYDTTPRTMRRGECTWKDRAIRRDEPIKVCHKNINDIVLLREQGIYTLHSHQASYLHKLTYGGKFVLKVHPNHRGCLVVDRVIR